MIFLRRFFVMSSWVLIFQFSVIFAGKGNLIESSLLKNTLRDSSNYFFYKPYDYGSQSSYNPGVVILNGAYGIWQVATQLDDRRIFKFDYEHSCRYLWDDVKNPFKTVREYGTKEFFLSEVIPSSLDLNNQQYFPNYGLHLIGAGMHSRKTEEWF
jgi:hypothetical protein